LKCEGGRFTAINQSVLIQRFDIPKEWNPNFANIASIETMDYTIQRKLGQIPKWSYDDICQIMFSKIESLSQKEQISFSREVLQRIQSGWSSSSKLISLAQKHCKVLDNQGNLRRPEELFQNNLELQVLFQGEQGKFADASYHACTLQRIGLKSISDVNFKDIQNSISCLQKKCHTLDSVLLKVKSILKVIKQNGLKFHDFNEKKWIPIETLSPRDFPDSLLWQGSAHALNKPFILQKPSNVYMHQRQTLIGSVAFIIHSSIEQEFISCFTGTNYVNRPVIFRDVMQHLKHLENCNSDEKAHCE